MWLKYRMLHWQKGRVKSISYFKALPATRRDCKLHYKIVNCLQEPVKVLACGEAAQINRLYCRIGWGTLLKPERPRQTTIGLSSNTSVTETCNCCTSNLQTRFDSWGGGWNAPRLWGHQQRIIERFLSDVSRIQRRKALHRQFFLPIQIIPQFWLKFQYFGLESLGQGPWPIASVWYILVIERIAHASRIRRRKALGQGPWFCQICSRSGDRSVT